MGNNLFWLKDFVHFFWGSPNNNAPYNDCEKDVAEFNKIKETIEKMVQKIFKKQKNQVLYYFDLKVFTTAFYIISQAPTSIQ